MGKERWYGNDKHARPDKDVARIEPDDGKAEHGGYVLERRPLNGCPVWAIIPQDGQTIPDALQGDWTELRYIQAKIDFHNGQR